MLEHVTYFLQNHLSKPTRKRFISEVFLLVALRIWFTCIAIYSIKNLILSIKHGFICLFVANAARKSPRRINFVNRADNE